ncbi:MAG: hypothetical protein Q9163_003708 [Psora crenata]
MFKYCAFAFLLFSLQAGHSLACTAVQQVHLTNYGFPDASGLTQFSCSGSTPGTANVPTPLGSGTHSSPYAFAASATTQTFQKCETIYIPYFRKYFKFVDVCAACESDQNAGKLHIDLYLVQSNSDIGQTPCELSFGVFGGTSYTVIRDPNPNLPVEAGALFEGGTCYNDPANGRVFPADSNTDSCSGGGARHVSRHWRHSSLHER